MLFRLSSRLATVAKYVLPGKPMADVGTDHAQLPISLLHEGVIPSAVALDVAQGPFRIAQQASEGKRISVRLSDGLDGLDKHEVSTICICGMGGNTMADILQRGQSVWRTSDRLVLQPQGMAKKVRKVVTAAGWDCIDGEIVDDRGKLFVVEVWQRSSSEPKWSDLDYRWGKMFRALPDPLFGELLKNELADIEFAMQRMKESGALDHPAATVAHAEKQVILAELLRIR